MQGVPILASIAALRGLGAVVDFEADVAVFRSIDPWQAVELERSPAGHLLLDLVNLMKRPARPERTRGLQQLAAAQRAANAAENPE